MDEELYQVKKMLIFKEMGEEKFEKDLYFQNLRESKKYIVQSVN